MRKEESKMNATTIGLDIAKQVFQVHGVDRTGKTVLRKQLKRAQVLAFFANLPPALIGIEACAGAHYWARELIKQGHAVRLIAPQFVKPYVKGNKNDANDAEAICEAVGRPSMRFVPLKCPEQQDIQMLHRIRQNLITQRTAVANQTRGLLGEYGLVIARGLSHLRRQLPEILEDAGTDLSPLARRVFADSYDRLIDLDRQIQVYQQQLETVCRQSPVCRQLLAIPGIGPITATAMVAALGDGQAFANGRQVAAWLGRVPRQESSGGKPRLLGISKRGDTYLRTLLIHGARAVVRAAMRKDDAHSRWINALVQRRNANIAAVAVANKTARTIWAMLTRGEDYRVPLAQVA
jgi:transposase